MAERDLELRPLRPHGAGRCERCSDEDAQNNADEHLFHENPLVAIRLCQLVRSRQEIGSALTDSTGSTGFLGARAACSALRYLRTVPSRGVERKAEVAELLLEASRQLGETLEPERIYDRFHDLLAGVIPHDGVVVSSYDEQDGIIRCDYAWVEGNRLDPATLPPLPLNRRGGGMQSRVILTGESLLANDVPERVQEPGGTYYNVDREGAIRKLPESGRAGTQAAMMVPVKHERRVVGVVQLMTDRQEYTPEQLEVFEGLVAQLAAAVRNAHLQKERRRLEAGEAAESRR